MTKEEVLQKANDYCNEKGYTTETLTDDFKEKFSDFFAKKYPETDADDETMIADLQFNLNTAFSATSKGITSKQKAFDERENSYKNQIAELTKKLGKKDKPFELPKDVQDQLDEFKAFKNNELKENRRKEVLEIAKKGIRNDLHKSFDSFAKNIGISLDKDAAEQAKEMVASFQNIFMDTVGDIKPLAPKQKMQLEDEVIATVKKVTL